MHEKAGCAALTRAIRRPNAGIIDALATCPRLDLTAYFSRDWSWTSTCTSKVGEQECLTRAGELEQELNDLASTSPLAAEPDEARVEAWVLDAYRRRWAM